MQSLVKFAKKFLMSEPFFVDGFEYQFVSVEEFEGGFGIDILVNVILPKRGQSYLLDKFSHDISVIIENLGNYYGKIIAYNEMIYVEGKPTTSKVYISPEDSNELMTSLNENVRKVKVPKMLTGTALGAIYIQADISFEKNENYKFASAEHSSINFYFLYNLSNIELSVLNRGVETNFIKISSLDERIDKFATIINDILQDNDKFRDKIESIIYMTLEPSLKLDDTDFYTEANYWINKINGNKVEPESIGNLTLLDFFDNPS